jgi:GT2 family glycosyltransferase
MSPVFSYYLSGANALVNREKLLTLGGFNEFFAPFYQEDLDLSLRAWELGWVCFYEDAAQCRHEVSKTITAYHEHRYIQVINTRNKLILHYLHLRNFQLILWICSQVLIFPFRWALGQPWYYSGMRLFFERFKAIQLGRQKFNKLRAQYDSRLPLKEIKKRIRNSVENPTL